MHVPKGKRQLNVYITEATFALLEQIRARDGVPFTAQAERAIRLWAGSKGLLPPGAPEPEGDDEPAVPSRGAAR